LIFLWFEFFEFDIHNFKQYELGTKANQERKPEHNPLVFQACNFASDAKDWKEKWYKTFSSALLKSLWLPRAIAENCKSY